MEGTSPIASAPIGASGSGTGTSTGGDDVRDAFRYKLADIVSAAYPAITWSITDAVNTTENPDAGSGFIALEFGFGSEDQFSFGVPGNNLWLERGPVFVHVVAPLGESRNTAELYARQIRTAFRGARFTRGALTIRVMSTSPLGGGQVEGGDWVETVALQYQVFNRG